MATEGFFFPSPRIYRPGTGLPAMPWFASGQNQYILSSHFILWHHKRSYHYKMNSDATKHQQYFVIRKVSVSTYADLFCKNLVSVSVKSHQTCKTARHYQCNYTPGTNDSRLDVTLCQWCNCFETMICSQRKWPWNNRKGRSFSSQILVASRTRPRIITKVIFSLT